MPNSPNKLSRFWQELKRRNVVRVITVYAASAFVILELVDILAPSLGLPDWTLNLVLILLIVGFVIAVIVSWIYDIHPEGGVFKTESAQKHKPTDIQKSSNIWKIASYISFAVIVGLIVLNILPRTNRTIQTKILDKSIAVLPFINDSQDEENTYFINGIMEEILLNLQAIKDFQVPGRTSVEPYRNQAISVPEIAKALSVNYIIEGSGQKYGNTIRLRVQLLEGSNGMHLWGKSYEEVLDNPEDIFRIQSQIAESIARELKTVITPEEKEVIEKIPTTSLAAYDYYLQAREKHLLFLSDFENQSALKEAVDLYSRSLQYDSTFSLSYSGLGMIKLIGRFSTGLEGPRYTADYFKEDPVDSIEILADLALELDKLNVEAYILLGYQNLERGELGKAFEFTEKALQINPNHSFALIVNGLLYYSQDDYVNWISQLTRALKVERGALLPFLHEFLYLGYWSIGFADQAEMHLKELISLTSDSVHYYNHMSSLEDLRGNPEKAAEYSSLCYYQDTLNASGILEIGEDFYWNRQYQQTYYYYSRYFNMMNASGILCPNYMHRMGHVLWSIDRKEEANVYFSKFIELANNCIQRNNFYGTGAAHYDLAGVYAFLGESEKAYEQLQCFSEASLPIHAMLNILKKDPMFESIRHEQRFRQLGNQMESKYQAEHERFRQWLEENDML